MRRNHTRRPATLARFPQPGGSFALKVWVKVAFRLIDDEEAPVPRAAPRPVFWLTPGDDVGEFGLEPFPFAGGERVEVRKASTRKARRNGSLGDRGPQPAAQLRRFHPPLPATRRSPVARASTTPPL